MSARPSVVGLIPARSGSRRVPDKNIRPLAGHPLLAYTIASANESRVFDHVIVSTDSEEYAGIARRYGASVPFLRPAELAGEFSTDVEWVSYTLRRMAEDGRHFDSFSILRPTSPFRGHETIRRAWKTFLDAQNADSLRAVEPCSQHPGKMWVIRGGVLLPLLPYETNGVPWHNSPYQSLPTVYAQNASLEIAWSRVVLSGHSISGTRIVPFLTEGYEGYDINEPEDLDLAEYLIQLGRVSLPKCHTVV